LFEHFSSGCAGNFFSFDFGTRTFWRSGEHHERQGFFLLRHQLSGHQLTHEWEKEERRQEDELADWSRRFDEPIVLPSSRKLITLRDAGEYIAVLAPKVQKAPESETAAS
jgi:hypothetical protein